MFAQRPPADEEDPPVLRVMRHSLQGSHGTVACETPKSVITTTALPSGNGRDNR